MEKTCVHSCKGLCNALEAAERRVEDSLAAYRSFASSCDYPDVRAVLDELIRDGEKSLAFIREKRQVLSVQFSMIDSISDSFA